MTTLQAKSLSKVLLCMLGIVMLCPGVVPPLDGWPLVRRLPFLVTIAWVLIEAVAAAVLRRPGVERDTDRVTQIRQMLTVVRFIGPALVVLAFLNIMRMDFA